MPEPRYAALVSRVEETLSAFLDLEEDKALRIAPEVAPLAAQVRRAVMSGGKRIRSLLCYWAWQGVTGRESDAVLRASSSLELLHAFALAHDDVVDESGLRRGEPSMHKVFERLHAEREWGGDGARYGKAVAILGGDLLLSFADQLFFGSGVDAAALERARPIYDTLRSEMIWGQYLDLHVQTAGLIDRELARRVLQAKSGHYTAQKPLLIGGALGGAPPDVLEAYGAYGTAAGEAFQLRDDVLGIFGDPEQTGKPAGGDLREGKRTLVVAEAYAAADEESRAFLLEHLGDRRMARTTMEQLRRLIVETGALARAEEAIADATERALAALDGVRLASGVDESLRAMAIALRDRRF